MGFFSSHIDSPVKVLFESRFYRRAVCTARGDARPVTCGCSDSCPERQAGKDLPVFYS